MWSISTNMPCILFVRSTFSCFKSSVIFCHATPPLAGCIDLYWFLASGFTHQAICVLSIVAIVLIDPCMSCREFHVFLLVSCHRRRRRAGDEPDLFQSYATRARLLAPATCVRARSVAGDLRRASGRLRALFDTRLVRFYFRRHSAPPPPATSHPLMTTADHCTAPSLSGLVWLPCSTLSLVSFNRSSSTSD